MNKEEAGRKAWLALHSYTQNGEWSPERARRYYQEQWLPLVPRFASCDCQSEWSKITAANPPVFTSEKEFIEWGFHRHNDVNRRLGKPEMPIAEAWKIRSTQ